MAANKDECRLNRHLRRMLREIEIVLRNILKPNRISRQLILDFNEFASLVRCYTLLYMVV